MDAEHYATITCGERITFEWAWLNGESVEAAAAEAHIEPWIGHVLVELYEDAQAGG